MMTPRRTSPEFLAADRITKVGTGIFSGDHFTRDQGGCGRGKPPHPAATAEVIAAQVQVACLGIGPPRYRRPAPRPMRDRGRDTRARKRRPRPQRFKLLSTDRPTVGAPTGPRQCGTAAGTPEPARGDPPAFGQRSVRRPVHGNAEPRQGRPSPQEAAGAPIVNPSAGSS